MKKLTLKEQEFKKNLFKHKFNQTKAYQETYPDSSPKASESHGSRKTEDMVRKGKVSTDELREQSKDIIKELYNTKSVKLEKKADIAIQIAKRDIPEKIQTTANVEVINSFYEKLKARGINPIDLLQEN